MIRVCTDADFEAVLSTINDGAEAYRGVVPPDRLPAPYMSEEALRQELDAGVRFFAETKGDAVLGVMGIQPVQDVMLIRHAMCVPQARDAGLEAGCWHTCVPQPTVRC